MFVYGWSVLESLALRGEASATAPEEFKEERIEGTLHHRNFLICVKASLIAFCICFCVLLFNND